MKAWGDVMGETRDAGLGGFLCTRANTDVDFERKWETTRTHAYRKASGASRFA